MSGQLWEEAEYGMQSGHKTRAAWPDESMLQFVADVTGATCVPRMRPLTRPLAAPPPGCSYAFQWWLLPVHGPGLTSSPLGLLASVTCILLILLLAAMLTLAIPSVRCG